MHLAGELSKISLPSLMQLVRNGGLTGEISISQGTKTASVFVEDGRLVHVETDDGAGRDAFMELFLWVTGSFSFSERDIGDIPRSIDADDPPDRILREGLAYLDQKKYLDQLRISSQTVLRRTDLAAGRKDIPLLDQLDGHKNLAKILSENDWSRREYIRSIHQILTEGLATVVDSRPKGDIVDLPGWVVARLKQDNADLSQAIVDMVIWVDRVKCWMYQADAELYRLVDELDELPEQLDSSTAPAGKESESKEEEPERAAEKSNSPVSKSKTDSAEPASPEPDLPVGKQTSIEF